MKPQQQDLEAKKESGVYVQTPEGEQINVKKDSSANNENKIEGAQTAENTPTKSSSEVTSGEDA